MSPGENHGVVVIFIYFENYFITPSLQHLNSFGFVVCVEKQFLDKLILPTCDEKINKTGVARISFLSSA